MTETGVIYNNSEKACQNEVWQGYSIQFSKQYIWQIVIIQQSRNADLKEDFCYPLGPLPWSIAYSSGDMIKTSKSVLILVLEKGAPEVN